MKLVYVTTSPIPYVTPILNSLARLVDLHVVYLSRVEETYDFVDPWGAEPAFSHSFAAQSRLNRPIKLSRVDLLTYVSFGVSAELSRLDADVVCVTSWGPQTIEPVAWARRRGKAVVIWAESTAWSGMLRDPFSSALRRWCVGRADAFLSNGSEATRYLHGLGAAPAAIVTSRLPSGLAAQTDPGSVIGAGPNFLFAGRLVARKQPLEVIQAFELARPRLPGSTLSVVGDGPLMADVNKAAQRAGDSVRVLGRQEGEALSDTYRECDVLVLPAKREVWGLVVNEALAHGMFVIASDEVGSAHDLLTSENGLMVRVSDPSDLLAALLATGDIDRSATARRQRAETVADCTPERMADDWARAAELSVERSGQRRASTRRRQSRRSGADTTSHQATPSHRRWQS